MAKDYFQDILPPQGAPSPKRDGGQSNPPAKETGTATNENETTSVPISSDAPAQDTRSIRNISVSPRTPRRAQRSEREVPEVSGMQAPPPRRTFRRMWIWIVAAFSIVALGAIVLVALRPTTVTVMPRSHVIVFDSSLQFRAYPGGEAAASSLSYTTETLDLEDSAVVAAQGTEVVEERARGTITVVNNYSAESVRLIKNTRFETPSGLIFRAPDPIVIPGKVGTRPGEVSVEVVADTAGEKYNVDAVARFTLPGLETTPAMYADVFARSSAPMSGGFSGERPIVTPNALESAKAEIRGRLEQKARASVQTRVNEDTVALADLIRITYTSLPHTEEAGGGARVREQAHVEIPVFPAGLFAQTVARGVSADAEEGSIMLRDVAGLTARLVGSSEPTSGAAPFDFALEGAAELVWNVDAAALAEALAGRDEAAFEAIAASFPGVEEAHARVQPFWKNSFPSAPDDIQVYIEEPKAQ